ncbi:MAG TPA: ABC transporter substrate-binding protein [Candidatus Limnocylindrales bacterium]|jgi:NitT/TauT family transport system substrate-binding protein|nr:ABC transporter substrate-binding protein [Candidatus Limnocylindrales bacterium]
MRRRRTIALFAALSMAVMACSSGGGATQAPASAAPSAAASAAASEAPSAPAELKPIRLQLQWFPQAQFAGYFAAKDMGYYAEEGFDVTILAGAVEIVPATVVAGGQAEFGISWVPRMLAPRESGADPVVIAQVFQRSPTLQVSFKDKNITKPEDLRGKRVGSWGFGNEAELYAGLRKAGLDPDNPSDVTIVAQQFDMVAFAAGEIDAAQAMIYNEYAQVLETKNPATGELFKPEDLNVISWEEYGTSMLQDAIFASEAWLAQAGNEDDAVKFLKASFKGWIFCRDNPEECVDIVLKAEAALPKGHQTWQLNEVSGIIWPAPNGIGITDSAAFDRTVQVALDGKILTKPVEGTPWRNDLAEKALAELTDMDTKGESWQKATVTLTEGGQ